MSQRPQLQLQAESALHGIDLPCSCHECLVEVILSELVIIATGKRGSHHPWCCMSYICRQWFVWVQSWSHLLELMAKVKYGLGWSLECLDSHEGGHGILSRLHNCEGAYIDKIIIISIIIFIVVFTAVVWLGRAGGKGLTVAADGADVGDFDWTVVTHAGVLLLGMSIAALDLGEMSNSWYLEERLAEIIGQIIVLDSIAPLPTLLTTYRAIKAREPLVGWFLSHRIDSLVWLYLYWRYCLSRRSSIRHACRIGSEVFTLFELFFRSHALRLLLTVTLNLCCLPLHFNW